MPNCPTAKDVALARSWIDRVRAGSPTAKYELEATEFYRETGYLAPGKSVPLAMQPTGEWEKARRPQWEAWCRKRARALCDTFEAALLSLEKEHRIPRLCDACGCETNIGIEVDPGTWVCTRCARLDDSRGQL